MHFGTGKGVDWGDHDPNLYEGAERFLKPTIVANIVSSWIPSLDGGRVEDIAEARRCDSGRYRMWPCCFHYSDGKSIS